MLYFSSKVYTVHNVLAGIIDKASSAHTNQQTTSFKIIQVENGFTIKRLV